MSLTTLPTHDADPTRLDAPVLDVVVPVYNEEIDLEPCVRRLHTYLATHFPYRFRITIADNASTDSTADVARWLTRELPGVTSVHLTEKGRGRALKHVWTTSDAAVLAYMDVDLSTDLDALLPLVAPLISGHSDLAIGSRLARGSRVVRGAKREFISRSYNLILRGALSARFSDAQCGFKAIRADVAERLLPMVEDTGWFFDTEMLVIAERAGLRIHEVPVDWVDDPDSRVDIVATAVADLKGIARLLRAFGTGRLPLATLREQLGRNPLPMAGVPAGLTGQLIRFAAVGVASTLAYLILYAFLRTAISPQWANLLALLVTAIANTAVNRRVTFGVRGTTSAWRHQAQGLIVFGIGLALTSGSLALLDAASPNPAKHVELAVLILANLLATAVRFLTLRVWVFRSRARSGSPASSGLRSSASAGPDSPASSGSGSPASSGPRSSASSGSGSPASSGPRSSASSGSGSPASSGPRSSAHSAPVPPTHLGSASISHSASSSPARSQSGSATA